MPTMQQIVCRVSGQIFVGSPLCASLLCFSSLYADSFTGWNHEYQKRSISFAANVIKSAYIISMFPKLLKP
jgi:hypothetical protein